MSVCKHLQSALSILQLLGFCSRPVFIQWLSRALAGKWIDVLRAAGSYIWCRVSYIRAYFQRLIFTLESCQTSLFQSHVACGVPAAVLLRKSKPRKIMAHYVHSCQGCRCMERAPAWVPPPGTKQFLAWRTVRRGPANSGACSLWAFQVSTNSK